MRSVANVRNNITVSRSSRSVFARALAFATFTAPLAPVLRESVRDERTGRAPRPTTSAPSRAVRDIRPPHRRPAQGNRESMRAARRTSAITPASSRVVRVRRLTCTMRVPRTHWARSLSGVQMNTRSTRGSSAAAAAAAASASSASNSTIGQTTTPAAVSASSSSGNCASRSGSMPSPVLYPGHKSVAKRLDDVIGRDGRCVSRRCADHG